MLLISIYCYYLFVFEYDCTYAVPQEGAETPVWLATEASQELTGLFFWDQKVISW